MAASAIPEAVTVDYENESELLSAKGLFSFSLYGNLNSTDGKANLYVNGVTTYLDMMHDSFWDGWKVVVHTTQESLDTNTTIFDGFRSKGAIIGISSLNTELRDIVDSVVDDYGKRQDYRGILRINRYYPFFIFDGPVLVRDADTIFERVMEYYLNNNDLETFKAKINEYEKAYFQYIIEKGQKVVYFSYDSNYGMKFEKRNTDVWVESVSDTRNKLNPSRMISAFAKAAAPMNPFYAAAAASAAAGAGAPSENERNRQHARFLAGVITKYCPKLPIELWNTEAYVYIHKKVLEYKEKNGKVLFGIQMIDEMYLSNIIYQYCKKYDIVGFFKMNYVDPSRYKRFVPDYFKAKYASNNIEKINTVNAKNKYIQSEYLKLKNTPAWLIRNTSSTEHLISQLAILENPKLAIQDEFFYNPLKNNVSKKPITFSSYYFGRRASRKARRNTSTRRRRTLRSERRAI